VTHVFTPRVNINFKYLLFYREQQLFHWKAFSTLKSPWSISFRPLGRRYRRDKISRLSIRTKKTIFFRRKKTACESC